MGWVAEEFSSKGENEVRYWRFHSYFHSYLNNLHAIENP